MEVAIALIASIVGAVLALAAQTFFSIRATNVSLIDDHIEDIKIIESIAVKYWLSSNEPAAIQSEDCQPYRLEGAMTASSCFNELASDIMGQGYKKYRSLDFELYDLCTGGDFRSKDRMFDGDRVIQIIECCNRLRSALRLARRSQYWIR
jgi:hypothetical protein